MPDDLIDFTPELRAQALENLKRYRRIGPLYIPPILGDVNGLLGAINIGNAGGGTNWPGASFDPETRHRLRAGQQLRRRASTSLVDAARRGFSRHAVRRRA